MRAALATGPRKGAEARVLARARPCARAHEGDSVARRQAQTPGDPAAASIAPAVPPAAIPGWERAFLVGALLAQQDAFLNLLRIARGADSADPNGEVGAVDPVSSGLVFLTLAGLAALTVAHRPAILAVVRRNGLSLALAGLVFLSTVWSVDGAITAKRAVVYLVSLGLPLYVAARLGLDGGLRLAASAFALAAVASLALGLAAPSVGVMHLQGLEGDWRGVFSHKNPLAQAMLLGVMAQAYLLARGGPGRRRDAAVLAIELLLIVLSRSFTALVVGAIALGAFGLFAGLRRGGQLRRVLTLAAPLGVALIAAAVIFFPQSLQEASGKDATLTGRTELWASVWDAIAERPFTGWGFQAFWRPENTRAQELWARIGWIAPNAHNGMLDVWLGLGVLGVALTLAVVVQALVRGSRLLRARGQALAGATVLIVACAILFRSFSEASLVRQSDADWIMFNLVNLAAGSLVLAVRETPSGREPTRPGVLPRARPPAAPELRRASEEPGPAPVESPPAAPAARPSRARPAAPRAAAPAPDPS